MESTLRKPALAATRPNPRVTTIVYWIVTALFCLQMGFTAYAQLRLPQVAEMFTHSASPPTSAWSSRGSSSSAWCCCLPPCRRGSRSGPTPASPSLSPRRSSPISRWAMGRRCGAGRRSRACSGDSRTSSGAACRPRRRAPERAAAVPGSRSHRNGRHLRRLDSSQAEVELLAGEARSASGQSVRGTRGDPPAQGLPQVSPEG